MKIEERLDLEDGYKAALKVAFGFDNKKRKGRHVSDLVYCLRKTYWRTRPDYEEELSDDSVLYFVRGRSLEDLIDKLFPLKQVKVTLNEIVGTIDAVSAENIPVEIKTTKRLFKSEPYDHHIKQLTYYMAMRNSQKGILLYYELQPNKLTVFELQLTKKELADIRTDILNANTQLNQILEFEDPYLVQPPEDGKGWECKFCDFRKECNL